MASLKKINNDVYDTYGDRWYSAYDDPVALLRAENRVKLPWIYDRICELKTKNIKILDIGCGAGFLCNGLAQKGLNVTGIDQSEESLKVARLYDETRTVNYLKADAYKLPFDSESMDVVTSLDFLEHVDRPDLVIAEISRVLRPGGLFFFHTFNRNFLSWLLVIKAIELIVKNTPKDMHVIKLFIKPDELVKYCEKSSITVQEMVGLRPRFSTIPLKNYFSGVVPEKLEFQLTTSLMLSYMGVGRKK